MFRGYNLTYSLPENDRFKELYNNGRLVTNKDKAEVIKTISSFNSQTTGILDGSKLRANWFPQIKADVFISHSHQNEKLAVALAGWLDEKFGVKAFIDSCVWGYADKLIGLLDRTYCKIEEGRYYYNLRNQSTSHVHMMLSSALTSMIDSTECLFFLNTPESILPEDVIKGDKTKTLSPWIYSEISMTKLIRERTAEDHRPKPTLEIKKASTKAMIIERIDRFLQMSHDMDLSHLTDIDKTDLDTWAEDGADYEYPLDRLYEIT